MSKNNEYEVLPRFDLREPQCRRFENIIAQAAVEGTQILDARKSLEMFGGRGSGMSSLTLALRLKDAILGFKRYKYWSKVIPAYFDLDLLEVKQLAGEMVMLKNLQMDLLNKVEKDTAPKASNKDKVKELLSKYDYKANGGKPLEIVCKDKQEVDWIMSVKGEYPQLDFDDLFEKFQMVKVWPK